MNGRSHLSGLEFCVLLEGAFCGLLEWASHFDQEANNDLGFQDLVGVSEWTLILCRICKTGTTLQLFDHINGNCIKLDHKNKSKSTYINGNFIKLYHKNKSKSTYSVSRQENQRTKEKLVSKIVCRYSVVRKHPS